MAKFSRHDVRNPKAGRKKRQVVEGFDRKPRKPRLEEYEVKRAAKYSTFRDYFENEE